MKQEEGIRLNIKQPTKKVSNSIEGKKTEKNIRNELTLLR